MNVYFFLTPCYNLGTKHPDGATLGGGSVILSVLVRICIRLARHMLQTRFARLS